MWIVESLWCTRWGQAPFKFNGVGMDGMVQMEALHELCVTTFTNTAPMAVI